MYTLSFQNSTESSHFLFICRPYFVISRFSTKIIPLYHTSMCSAHFNYLPIFSGLREVVIIACGTGVHTYIYIYIYIYVMVFNQLTNLIKLAMATFVTHSRITTSQIGKNGKGYQKKKTHTLFFLMKNQQLMILYEQELRVLMKNQHLMILTSRS